MRILIQGAGPAGLTLALALKRHGLEPALLERRAPGPGDGYVVGLRHNGLRAAAALGLDQAMLAARLPISEARYLRSDGRPFVSFDYARLMQAAPGGMAAILRGEIMDLLWSEAEGIETRRGIWIETIEQDGDGVTVSLSDGSTERAAAVIGADGHRSSLRRLVFGPDETHVTQLGYRVAAWRYQPGLELQSSVSGISDVGRQASIYRLGDGSAETLLVWRDADLSRHDRARKEARVRELFGDWPEPLSGAIARCPDWHASFADTLALVEMDSWQQGRVALLGDAAWSMALISGEGPSTAMAGAMVLAEELAADAGDVAAALTRYEARLRPVVNQIQAGARRIGGQFVPASRLGMMLQPKMMRLMTSRLMLGSTIKRMAAPEIAFAPLPGRG